MAILERLDNETEYEYGLRIICAKVDKEIDMGWDEICQLLKLNLHSDSIRKATSTTQYGGVAVAKYYEDKIEKMLMEQNKSKHQDIDNLIVELEKKKLELQKERVKISTLRNELNRTVREESRKELFYSTMRDMVINNPLEPVEFDLMYEPHGEKEYLLTFADVHYGSTFDIGENQYSPKICCDRFRKMFHQTVDLIQEEGISHLHIASCGDLVQGILRLSDVKLNSISMVEQIRRVSHLVANFLNQLSKYCKITYYHVINANHSELRLLGSKSGELAEDVELLIGNYIKDMLVINERVDVIIGSDSVMNIELCNYNIALTHGQNVKNKETYMRDLTVAKHIDYDFLIMGHIHHYSCVTVGTTFDKNPKQVISVPSIVGSCPYSQKIMKTSPSGALLLIFEKGKGKKNVFELNLN